MCGTGFVGVICTRSCACNGLHVYRVLLRSQPGPAAPSAARRRGGLPHRMLRLLAIICRCSSRKRRSPRCAGATQ